MKKTILTLSAAIAFLSSCEVEMVDGNRYHHRRGWEHSHYPNHHEEYNHGYHHDSHGGEIYVRPRK